MKSKNDLCYIGPFSPNKPAGQRSGPVKATTTVKMNFPAYSPPSNVHVSSPPVRSSSMREFHTIREVAEGSGGHGGPRPSTTHRTVSMSTQNLTDHQRQDNQTYHHHPHQVASKPKRSQSFNEKSMSGGGGSLVHSGLSSSSTSSTGSSSSNTAEYPSKTSHIHSGYRTYPLRETASLQILPSSASYGNNAKTSHRTDSHLHQMHGSHHGGHHGQSKSSSVRNIPSASGYNITTTTTATAVASSSSSLSGQSGRPMFSQPISATAARVESVDIPTQPQTSATMATNVRDLSSSYPGHHHSRAGSSSSRATSGQIHAGVSRGENPKPSRRHLHKV